MRKGPDLWHSRTGQIRLVFLQTLRRRLFLGVINHVQIRGEPRFWQQEGRGDAFGNEGLDGWIGRGGQRGVDAREGHGLSLAEVERGFAADVADVEEEEFVARREGSDEGLPFAVAVGGDHVAHLNLVGAGDLMG